MSSNAASYADCVSSLRTSLQFLESSVETLDSGVSDLPRLATVLKTVRVRYFSLLPLIPYHIVWPVSLTSAIYQHYELIPQSSLAAAETSLRDEIGPYIALLLSRADAQIERQDRRIETLKARSELQQGRINAATGEHDDSGNGYHHQKARSRGRQLNGEDKLRARAVRQRKEALRYGVERLELEVLQKERELRKRLDG